MAVCLLGAWLASPPVGAAVNECFPSDFVALPPGVNAATWYLFDRHAEGPYADGRRLAD